MLLLAAVALLRLLRPVAADLIAVSPAVLSTKGGGTLTLTGDSHGGLLAGSAWAGQAAPPSNRNAGTAKQTHEHSVSRP